MHNFKDTYALFSSRNACLTVTDVNQLVEKVLELLNNDPLRQAMANETLAISKENRGAAHASALHLKGLLAQCQNKLIRRRNG
ncbi:hypothetical protein SDC9_208399 [bioreactor metagenome]|uniref:Uncharacterized protein n=1 Tax=bioreactor metagenome TaxID=1076179 RepID=A0A645JAI8_9ZZZZ